MAWITKRAGRLREASRWEDLRRNLAQFLASVRTTRAELQAPPAPEITSPEVGHANRTEQIGANIAPLAYSTTPPGAESAMSTEQIGASIADQSMRHTTLYHKAPSRQT